MGSKLGVIMALFKRLSGTFTQLGSDAAITVSLPDDVEVRANGSTIEARFNGVVKVTNSNPDITGNVRTGFFSNNTGTQNTPARINNFEAADLGAAPTCTSFIILMGVGCK